jgi:hypothetical protein
MSPFSKVEMSPFVLEKKDLEHERCGAGGAPTTNEPKRSDTAGSDSASEAEDAKTTSGSGAIVALGTPGKALVQGISHFLHLEKRANACA